MELSHRRQENELSDRAIVIQFCEDGQNEHYGNHVWILKSELPEANAAIEIIDFAAEYYGIDKDEAIELINPENIVDSAGAWDDEYFIVAVWERFELIGLRTNNGAIVIDADQVELEYRNEN